MNVSRAMVGRTGLHVVQHRVKVNQVGLMALSVLVAGVGSARAENPATMGFEARMVTTIGSHTNVSELKVKGARLRLEVVRGRTFSTMIADYGKKRLWLLAPAARQYLEQDLSEMSQTVPHFFHPGALVERKKIGEGVIAGERAIKYDAVVAVPGAKKAHDGILWEAVERPGYPLRWEDPEDQIIVEWKNAKLTDLEDSLFTLPDGYTAASLPRHGKPKRHQGQHRRKKQPQPTRSDDTGRP
jgi:hypothetical protein